MKEKLIISAKQAERLIYDMTKFSDHPYDAIKQFSEEAIRNFFEHNNVNWSFLIQDARALKAIPFVENLLGYEWHIPFENIEATVQKEGVTSKKLSAPGQINILSYYRAYKKSFDERRNAIRMNDMSSLLSCITHGISAIENYITEKAILWNKRNSSTVFDVKESRLDNKLNDWLDIMVGYKMNQSPEWSDFCCLKKINNDFKHTGFETQAMSYKEMTKILNKFRTGIAKNLFVLNLKFNDFVPSKIIRGIYLPDLE